MQTTGEDPIVTYGHSLVRRHGDNPLMDYLWCEACETVFASLDALAQRAEYCTR